MMKKAGEVLREIRLQKSLTIDDVFEGTKIRPSYIEAIERSDYSVFHSQTTVKGFLKNYALYLGLNPDNVIAIYRREQNQKSQNQEKRLKIKIPSFSLSANIFVFIAAFLIIAGVIGFFAYQYIQVSKPPQFDIIEPLDATTTTDDKARISVALPEKDKAVDLQINNRSITTVDANGNFFTSVDLVVGENKIIVTATNGFKKSATKEITIYRAKPNEVVVNKNINIVLQNLSSKPLDLSYRIDSNNIENKKFNPGEKLNLVAKDKFQIMGPNNINNLVQLIINQSVVGLLQNTPKQEITYDNNQIKITPIQ